jgi:hypothetical protein
VRERKKERYKQHNTTHIEAYVIRVRVRNVNVREREGGHEQNSLQVDE